MRERERKRERKRERERERVSEKERGALFVHKSVHCNMNIYV